MRLVLALALLLSIAFVAPEVFALPGQSVVTIDFDALGQDPPSQLCVVADFMTEPGAKHRPIADLECKLRADAWNTDTCDPELATDDPECQVTVDRVHGATAEELDRCVPGTGKGGVAVLHVSAAEVIGSPTLTERVARITLGQSPRGRKEPVQVRLIGGDYWPDSSLSVPMTDNAQLVRMTLRPRCFDRAVTIPDVRGECRDTTWTHARSKAESNGTYELRIHNEQHGTSTLIATVCKTQVFQASWVGDKLPDAIRLETSTFKFDWRRNCLSGNVCPAVGGDVHCPPDETQPMVDVCRYTCTGVTQFPASVRFSFEPAEGHRGSLEKSWSDTLTAPGQELESYIPPEQRGVEIQWEWDKPNTVSSRDRRSSRAADTIDYVQVRTPGGQIHDIRSSATQLRIPELDCGDSISYRYVGDRLFNESRSPVTTQEGTVSEIRLPDPSQSRADKVGLAVALGAGGRDIGGGGPASWGPYGEAQFILVFRQLRDWLPSNRVGVDVDLRAGAMFLGQPYCSTVVTTAAAAMSNCYGGTWEHVPFWLVPFTIGPNFITAYNVTFGLGLGPIFSTYHLSSDAAKVSRPVLFTGVAYVGYRLARAVTVEAKASLLEGEDIRARIFDDAGVLRVGRASGSGPAGLLGGLIRVDDLF